MRIKMVRATNKTNVADTLRAMWIRFEGLATEKIQTVNKTVNREMRIASLMQEREKLLRALGEKVYARDKDNKSNEPCLTRLTQIDKDLLSLQNNTR